MWQFSRMVMIGKIQVDDSRKIVSMPSNLFADLLKSSIASVFDEKWYLDKYPDVGQAIRNGTIQTPLGHYVEHGFYENRMPYSIKVDEQYYIEKYEDVKAALDDGLIRSAQDHFDEYGFREGRLPSEGWLLLEGPAAIDFRAAMNGGGRDGPHTSRRRKAGHDRI